MVNSFKTILGQNKPAHHNDQVNAQLKLKAARISGKKAWRIAYDKKRSALRRAGKLVTKNSPSSIYFA